MRILALEHDLINPTQPDLQGILRVEAAAVWDLQKRGIIRDIWLTTNGRHAVILLECSGAAEATTHLAGLPLVRQGLSSFEIMELTAYDGHERLFGPGLAPTGHHEEPPEY